MSSRVHPQAELNLTGVLAGHIMRVGAAGDARLSAACVVDGWTVDGCSTQPEHCYVPREGGQSLGMRSAHRQEAEQDQTSLGCWEAMTRSQVAAAMAAETGVSAPGADGHMPKVRWGEGVCRPQGVGPRMGVLLTGVLKAAKPAGPLHAGLNQLGLSGATDQMWTGVLGHCGRRQHGMQHVAARQHASHLGSKGAKLSAATDVDRH